MLQELAMRFTIIYDTDETFETHFFPIICLIAGCVNQMKRNETTYKSVNLAVNTMQYINNQLFEKYQYFMMCETL